MQIAGINAGILVAVKTVKLNASSDEQEAFQREIELHRMVGRHEHIVR